MDFDLYEEAKKLAGNHDLVVKEQRKRFFTGTPEEIESHTYSISFEVNPVHWAWKETSYHLNPIDALHEFGNLVKAFDLNLDESHDSISRSVSAGNPSDFDPES